MSEVDSETLIKPVDLRGILKYVPLFRGHVFVLCLDGAIVDHDNFYNILLDIAVLKNLNVKVILVFGIAKQFEEILEKVDFSTSVNIRKNEPVSKEMIEVAIQACAKVSHSIMEGMSRCSLKCAQTNVVRSKRLGIVGGLDQCESGKFDKVDNDAIQRLFDDDVIPVFQPIAYSKDGSALLINANELAAELAVSVSASKLMYVTRYPGLIIKGNVDRNLSRDKLKRILDIDSNDIDSELRLKAHSILKALDGGVPRAHVIDGRILGALLTEVFDKVGIGTMVHSNDYQEIRPASVDDIHSIFNIINNASKSEAIVFKDLNAIEANISRFYVYEIDGSIIACVCLLNYEKENIFELSSLIVQPFYSGRGVGKKMVDFAVTKATDEKVKYIYALTTQTYEFFEKVCLFQEGSLADLPEVVKKEQAASTRNSRVVKRLIGAA